MPVEVCRKVKALLLVALLASAEVHKVQGEIQLKSGVPARRANRRGSESVQGWELEAMMSDPALQEHGELIKEQMQTVFANPTFQMETKRVTELLEELVKDHNFQKQVERTAEMLEAMVTNPKLEEQAKRVAEKIESIAADANIQDNIDSQDPKVASEKLQKMMANPSFQKQAKFVSEEITAMFADQKLQEQSNHFATEMKAMMANRALQERATHLGEQIKSLIGSPMVQRQAKAVAEHLQYMAAEHTANLKYSSGSIVDKLVDKVAPRMFQQALESSPFHYEDLDETTLGTSAVEWVNNAGTAAGTATACFFLLSPMIQIFQLLRKQDANSLELINPFTMISMLLNCSMWVWFGVFGKVFPPIPCNAMGSVAALFYLVTCFAMKAKIKDGAPSWNGQKLGLSIGAAVAAAGVGVLSAILGESFAKVVGYVATAFNLVLYASPLTVISTVLKEKSSALLPPVQCWMQFANTIFWCIVGICTTEIQGIVSGAPIMIANFPGLALAITQLSLIFTYPAKKIEDDKKKR